MDSKVSMVLLKSIQLAQSYVKTVREAVYWNGARHTTFTVFNLCYKVLHNNRQDYIFPSLTRNGEGSTVWPKKQQKKNTVHKWGRFLRAVPPHRSGFPHTLHCTAMCTSAVYWSVSADTDTLVVAGCSQCLLWVLSNSSCSASYRSVTDQIHSAQPPVPQWQLYPIFI